MEAITSEFSCSNRSRIKRRNSSKLFGNFHLNPFLRYCQTCSMGLDSGQWGGWNIKMMLGGIFKFLALWNPPLSNWIIKTLSANFSDTNCKNISKHWLRYSFRRRDKSKKPLKIKELCGKIDLARSYCSRGLPPKYLRRCSVSPPSSGWNRCGSAAPNAPGKDGGLTQPWRLHSNKLVLSK